MYQDWGVTKTLYSLILLRSILTNFFFFFELVFPGFITPKQLTLAYNLLNTDWNFPSPQCSSPIAKARRASLCAAVLADRFTCLISHPLHPLQKSFSVIYKMPILTPTHSLFLDSFHHLQRIPFHSYLHISAANQAPTASATVGSVISRLVVHLAAIIAPSCVCTTNPTPIASQLILSQPYGGCIYLLYYHLQKCTYSFPCIQLELFLL